MIKVFALNTEKTFQNATGHHKCAKSSKVGVNVRGEMRKHDVLIFRKASYLERANNESDGQFVTVVIL